MKKFVLFIFAVALLSSSSFAQAKKGTAKKSTATKPAAAVVTAPKVTGPDMTFQDLPSVITAVTRWPMMKLTRSTQCVPISPTDLRELINRALAERQPCDNVGEVIEAELVASRTCEQRQLSIRCSGVTLPVPRRVGDRTPQVRVWHVEAVPTSRHLGKDVLSDVFAGLDVVREERSQLERSRPRLHEPHVERRR